MIKANQKLADMFGYVSPEDMVGIAKGDEILVKISDIFRCMTRSNDYAFRIGGEEFAILVTNTNKESAPNKKEPDIRSSSFCYSENLI